MPSDYVLPLRFAEQANMQRYMLWVIISFTLFSISCCIGSFGSIAIIDAFTNDSFLNQRFLYPITRYGIASLIAGTCFTTLIYKLFGKNQLTNWQMIWIGNIISILVGVYITALGVEAFREGAPNIIGVLCSLFGGSVVGTFQWRVAKRSYRNAYLWIPATASAWLIMYIASSVILNYFGN